MASTLNAVAVFPFTNRSKSISPLSDPALLDRKAFVDPNDMKSSLPFPLGPFVPDGASVM
jgi:hypothetical protein